MKDSRTLFKVGLKPSWRISLAVMAQGEAQVSKSERVPRLWIQIEF
ncbi:MAG: hypothetical protein AB1403_01490 [Candidatus Riflebacteria bacterium]